MRVFIKLLLFTGELAILFFGIVFSLLLGAVFYFDFTWGKLALIPSFLGLVLTIAILLLFRRKTRRWEIENEAASWVADRSYRRLHPRQARYLRFLHRCLLWLPSICAAFVFFFLPVASHVAYLGGHLVTHYRLPTPLNWMIIKGHGEYSFAWVFYSNEGAAKYGFTPIWFNHSFPSSATFGTTGPASPYKWWRPGHEIETGHATHVAKKEFKIGAVDMKCWEYRDIYHYGLGDWSSPPVPGVFWEVLCSTEPNGKDFNLHASFFGHKEEIPDFYKVLQGATLDQ